MRTVLLFGDSNTHGTMPVPDLGASDRFPREERWATRLAKLLPDWEVIAEGHPGRTTVHDDPIEGPHRNGLTVLPSLLESHQPIDVVLIAAVLANTLFLALSLGLWVSAMGRHESRTLTAAVLLPLGFAASVTFPSASQ